MPNFYFHVTMAYAPRATQVLP
ncbi:DUF1993 domain-containing protein [Sphingopyxis sp. YF1]|nr:DUF1993 domain-containing protein [Sphingopyxis sp. YF1]